MSNLYSYVGGLRLVLLLDHPQGYHARQYIGHEGGSISIALPPTTMLPTSIATLTGRSICLSKKANAIAATNTTHATMAAPHKEISDTYIAANSSPIPQPSLHPWGMEFLHS